MPTNQTEAKNKFPYESIAVIERWWNMKKKT